MKLCGGAERAAASNADEYTRVMLCSAEVSLPDVTTHADTIAVDLDRLYFGS